MNTSVSRPLRVCSICKGSKGEGGGGGRPVLLRSRTREPVCKPCFVSAFEDEILTTIQRCEFIEGETVAIGASGGKDSTVLAHVLNELNLRHDLRLKLVLVAIDEGIGGYRDLSLERVKETAATLSLPLLISSYEELFSGWSMDRVVEAAGGPRNACSFCGIFRRQALDRAASQVGARSLAVGHNADDVAETILMNLLRGDIARLGRCASIITGSGAGGVRRVRPLIFTYEKEIVSYAHHCKLAYHATDCTYSPAAYRGFLRELLKDVEMVRPLALLDLIRSASMWRVDDKGEDLIEGKGGEADDNDDDDDDRRSITSNLSSSSSLSSTSNTIKRSNGRLSTRARVQVPCASCGYLTSRGVNGSLPVCMACNLLVSLAAGSPRVALSSGRQQIKGEKRKMMALTEETGEDTNDTNGDVIVDDNNMIQSEVANNCSSCDGKDCSKTSFRVGK